MKRTLKVALSCIYLVSTRALTMCGWSAGTTRVVLTYHAVADDETVLFDRQMQQLRQLVTPVFADDPCAASTERQASVTFDDAFDHVIRHILPILSRYEIPAMIFVPTGCLGTAASWMRDDREATVHRVASAELLRGLNPRTTRLGSHTVSHPRLGAISSQQVEAELADSKSTLELLLGAPVSSLALPYGSFNAQVIRTARRVGYRHVFANVPVSGGISPGCEVIGRVDCSPRDWPLEFYLKLQGAYEWMAIAVPLKRQVLRLMRASAPA